MATLGEYARKYVPIGAVVGLASCCAAGGIVVYRNREAMVWSATQTAEAAWQQTYGLTAEALGTALALGASGGGGESTPTVVAPTETALPTFTPSPTTSTTGEISIFHKGYYWVCRPVNNPGKPGHNPNLPDIANAFRAMIAVGDPTRLEHGAPYALADANGNIVQVENNLNRLRDAGNGMFGCVDPPLPTTVSKYSEARPGKQFKAQNTQVRVERNSRSQVLFRAR